MLTWKSNRQRKKAINNKFVLRNNDGNLQVFYFRLWKRNHVYGISQDGPAITGSYSAHSHNLTPDDFLLKTDKYYVNQSSSDGFSLECLSARLSYATKEFLYHK